MQDHLNSSLLKRKRFESLLDEAKKCTRYANLFPALFAPANWKQCNLACIIRKTPSVSLFSIAVNMTESPGRL
jgi:predicted metal-binding protein